MAVIIYVAVTLANLTSAWIGGEYAKYRVQGEFHDVQQTIQSMIHHK